MKAPPLDPSNGVSTTYDAVLSEYRPPTATVADAVAAFGEQTAVTGSINLDLNTPDGRKNRGILAEMVAPDMRVSGERGAKRSAAFPTVTMRQPDGALRSVPEAVAERAEANGMRVVERRNPMLRYVNGLWYRRVRGEWVHV